MSDIQITKLNSVWMKVICTEKHMELDISDRFKFLVPGAEHDPRVKKGVWDGYKKLYNRQNRRMYVGLLFELLKFCNKQGYSTSVDPDLLPNADEITDDDLDELIKFINPHSDGCPIDPYDYQREGVKYMLNMNRTTCLAATSAGKSLIIYLALRIYQLMDEMQGKTMLVIVPSKSLVEQMYSDFKDYSTYEGSDWHVTKYVQKVSGDYDKNITHPIVVTTWQSLSKLPKYIFEDVGAVFVDETHGAQAKVLADMLESMTTTEIRHGLTGTLDGEDSNEFVIQGLLGPVKRIVTAKELIDSGRAAYIKVYMSLLQYPQHMCKQLDDLKKSVGPKKRYNEELVYIYQHEQRREFLKSMIASIPGNSLVIFDRVDEYGKQLYEEFKSDYPDYDVFLNVGEVGAEEREQIRTSMEQYDNAKIFATFGTMKQGVSIKKLHNLFIISSSKSKIQALQSIGRLMRLHCTKDIARIIDIVDNLTYNGEPNYCMLHAEERIKYYNNEEFELRFDTYNLPKHKDTVDMFN